MDKNQIIDDEKLSTVSRQKWFAFSKMDKDNFQGNFSNACLEMMGKVN